MHAFSHAAADLVAADVPAIVAALRLTVLVKLLLATVLGGAIGLEREVAGKPAGLRTNMLICVGAALFMVLSIDVAEIGFSADGHPYGDTTRIAAQIVSGIGFLGAGAILHSEGVIVGLTSAATVWVVAAVGAAAGAGSYVDAVGATVLIVLVLVGLRPLEARLSARRRHARATVRVKPDIGFGAIEPILVQCGVHVIHRRTFDHDTDRTFELELVGSAPRLDSVVHALRRNEHVISAHSE